MAGAAAARDYAGAAIVFSAAAMFAGVLILAPSGSFTSFEVLSRNALLIGGAGVSAAVSSRLLHPLAHRLAAHQYFLRPLVMGFTVVAVAHLLFGLIVSPLGEVLALLTLPDHRFEAQKFFAGILLLSVGGLFAWVVTVPAGILAAYCIEIVGWIREDARRRRNGAPRSDDQAGAAE